MTRHFPKYRPSEAIKTDWTQLVRAHSPYLSAGLDDFGAGLAGNPEEGFGDIIAETRKALEKKASTEDLMRILRKAKRKIAALIAFADLSGAWDDVTVMQKLSDFADFCVRSALNHLLEKAQTEKKISKVTEKNCGVCVIALGKWGAHELNYSSDIDLMVLFDVEKSPVKDKDETQNFFIRMTRDLARIIDQPTEDGYVFRTDLRLRPDPGAMPLAVSIGTAEIYYGSLGQNWERAAMIKARAVAGDAGLGRDFAAIMHTWIWRKSLDFAAIQDIHSIKRQINARQKHTSGGWQNFNVKLGHGGIREIEFFAQTQQLIFGGRQPELRQPQTLAALETLERTAHISEKARHDLHDAYLFLRRIEHRLQMIDDRQTHSLPSTAADLKNFAAFAGYPSAQKLEADLEKHTDAVKKNYAALFGGEQTLSGPGNLVFTGVEDDPETIDTLKKLGFRAPEKITAAIRGWHHGRYRAMRSEKARQILTELVPPLLQAFGKTPQPDDAFIRFDAFLSRLPAGVPIFSMFARNPQQMQLVADVMGTSPLLADYLGTHPQVLDGVLTKDFFGRLPAPEALKKELSGFLQTARDYEDILDAVRRWTREKRFHAGIHILKNLSPPAATAAYLSDIAEAVLGTLIPCVEEEFSKTHGRFKNGELIIIAMGSFAARHMFFDSDLDIVGLYAMPKEKQSTGAKPLSPNAYYIRLMQRVISALEAPTSEGILYKTDTRLRPSGADGPLAASLDSYFAYQQKDAWVWEHMSLIRSRAVYAAAGTAKAFETKKKQALSVHARGNDGELRKEMLDMRARVEREFGSKDPWNLKYARGGIMDIMFAAHFLMLKNGVFHADLGAGLALLHKKKLLSKKDFDILHETLRLAEAAQGFLRLTAELPFMPEKSAGSHKQALVLHALPKKKMTFAAFERQLKQNCAAAYAIYKKILK